MAYRLNPAHPMKTGTTIGLVEPGAGHVIDQAIHISSPRNGSPFKAQELAATLVSVLNGLPAAPADAGSDFHVHYQVFEGGVILRHRQDGRGVSMDGIDFTVSSGLKPETREHILSQLKSPDTMGRLCHAVEYAGPSHGGHAPHDPAPRLS